MSDPSLHQTLSCQRLLPLAWTTLAMPADQATLDDEALHVLTAVSVLEVHRLRSDDPDPVELEIERLHVKLDALIDLVGASLAGRDGRPAAVPLMLSSQGVSWPACSVPAVGSHGLVALYLHRGMPQPLRLAAWIRQVDGERVHAEFARLGDAVQAALERHVFLHHRRAVAENRQTGRTV